MIRRAAEDIVDIVCSELDRDRESVNILHLIDLIESRLQRLVAPSRVELTAQRLEASGDIEAAELIRAMDRDGRHSRCGWTKALMEQVRLLGEKLEASDV